MGIVRTSACAFHKLSLATQGRRTYTHVSQPMYKSQQQDVTAAQRRTGGWAIPAILVLVGLGFSTFSTHKLVSGNETIKMLSSRPSGKQ